MNRETLLKTLALSDLKFFLRYTLNDYQYNWHIDQICEELQEIINGNPRNLIINVGPRMGKSFIISERFPALFLANNPSKNIIVTGYGDDIATKFTTEIKNVYETHLQEITNIGLSKDVKSKRTFKTSEGGQVIGRGIQGSLTGMGGDVIIVDDPTKNAEEANSKTIRDKVWDGFVTNVWTRRSPTSSVIIVQTRFHLDDLTGRILNNPEIAKEFKVLSFPALDDSYETGTLFPQRFPLEDILTTKKIIGTKAFQALYQQTPITDGGNIIKGEWIKRINFNEVPLSGSIFCSWDLTFDGGENSDFVVCQVWKKTGPAEVILIEELRGRWEFTLTLKKMIEISNKYPGSVTLVEKKANGSAALSMLANKIPMLKPITPTKSKESRLNAVAPLFEAGNVKIVNNFYTDDLIEEIITFPNAKNDDRVDAMSQALQYIFIDNPTVLGMGAFMSF